MVGPLSTTPSPRCRTRGRGRRRALDASAPFDLVEDFDAVLGFVVVLLPPHCLDPAAVWDDEVHKRQHDDERQYRVNGDPQRDSHGRDYQRNHDVEYRWTSRKEGPRHR